MARKSLGKMEFAQLIDSLKEQNQNQLEAQQQTTKSIQDLTAYFFQQDREEARRRLEDQMETRKDAEQVTTKGKGLKGVVDATKGALRGKGLMGVFSNFLATGLLGSAGAGLFRSAIGAIKFNSGFGMKIGKLFTGALVLPSLWQSISAGIDEYGKSGDISDSLAKAATTFFKDDPVTSAGLGALAGFTFAGPKGAIAGALLGGAVSALSAGIGKEGTGNLISSIGDFFTGPAGMAALAGIYGGKALMKQKIVKGKGLRLFGARGMRVGLAAMIIGPVLGAIEKGMKPSEEDAGISGKISKFLFSTDHGTSVADAALTGIGLAALGPFGIPGMIAGGVLGIAYASINKGLKEKGEADLLTKTSESLGSFFTKLDLGLSALIGGDEKAQEMLDQIQFKEGRQDALDALFSQDASGNLRKNFEQFRTDQGLGYDSSKGTSDAEQTYQAQLKYLQSTKAGKDLKIVKQDSTGKLYFDDKALGDLFKYKDGIFGQVRSVNRDTLDTINSLVQNIAMEKGVSITEGRRAHGGLNPDLEKAILAMDENRASAIDVTQNARGAQVYRKPTLALVAEKPGSAEYIMSDRNLARLAETIATQRENQTMTSMIPIMMGQGGGGTSMPVINNSYSYQNTENTVREMPTTSSLNMMTALT